MDLSSEKYRIKHEWLNIISHGIGFILSIYGFILLYQLSNENTTAILAFGIYSLSLSLVFLSSTIYHIFSLGKNAKLTAKARIIDHIMIFFLIAGSYTPFILLKVSSEKSIIIFYLLWILVAFGTVLKLFFLEKTQTLGLIIYLIMGSLFLFFLDDMRQNLTTEVMYILQTGGLLYLIGVVFYKIKKIPYNHFIWHLFVIAASFFIYLATYKIL